MLTASANFLVRFRHLIFVIMVVATGVCAVLTPRVGVINDMVEFLPATSQMRAGTDIMEVEFPGSMDTSSTRVMFTGLTASEEESTLAKLQTIPNVDSVGYEARTEDSDGIYHQGDHTLFIVESKHAYGSAEDAAIQQALTDQFAIKGALIESDNPSPTSELPLWIVMVAVGLLALILFAMCASWLEPILFLVTIGMAVVLNLGTNLIRGSIADVTFTIGAILQLVLSMDYSIILMNRYRQEKTPDGSRPEAMVRAIRGAFSSIVSSSMTTVVGLLMLCFMSLLIGMDLGIALAKGVFLSMVSVFTILPTLILWCDRAIEKTAKPYLRANFHPLLHGSNIKLVFRSSSPSLLYSLAVA
ncbi:efflux RND transporter permease subunit [Pauljensenia sp. UMB1177]|uniref:efflux RND transporter permease subunit n=1 Tax=Pauljensenia sp. UMB1177 TaxID=3046323 RepID=UPI00254F3B63|nr:efflux RND transporter permease subunit [Pauljensenia sp. UMB1177]